MQTARAVAADTRPLRHRGVATAALAEVTLLDHPDARKVSVEDAYDAVRDELQPLPKTSGTEKL